jgi:hypothetical protein
LQLDDAQPHRQEKENDEAGDVRQERCSVTASVDAVDTGSFAHEFLPFRNCEGWAPISLDYLDSFSVAR